MNATKSVLSSDAQAIVSSLCDCKGQNIYVSWTRECKTYKGETRVVTKTVRRLVRAGIDYSKLASVQQGIASGAREEVQPLPAWQEWAQFPFVLRHKENGTEYVRLFPASFDNGADETQFFIDGKPATREEIEPLVMASEKSKSSEEKTCFNVKVDSITNVGK